MKTYIKLFFIALPILIAFDASWVGVIAGQVYKYYLGSVFAPTFNHYAIGVFYILYSIGILYFCVLPAQKEASFTQAFIKGSALGFTVYMTYDLINMGVLPNWPLPIAVLDIAWGSILTACVSALTYLLANKLFDANPHRLLI